ncbi:hypothetical protein SFRURICE_013403 [Spodoptera frugiperda]|nr:hypothetical protein SFRURICE_013403 [Spodoptera frugiperda]
MALCKLNTFINVIRHNTPNPILCKSLTKTNSVGYCKPLLVGSQRWLFHESSRKGGYETEHKISNFQHLKNGFKELKDELKLFKEEVKELIITDPLLVARPDSSSVKINEDMLSVGASTTASEDSFITPVSSVGDLMTMSPKRCNDGSEQRNETSDLLTGSDYDSICDVTMKEVPMSDDMFIDATSLDYLVKCAESNRNHNHIDRGKESLFVKFDPLYARQKLEDASSVTTESAVDSSECDVGYETGSTVSNTENNVIAPKHSQSTGAMPSLTKPMQVVPPVVNSENSKTSGTCIKSTPALMRSVSAILTPSRGVATERLISISGSTPPTAAPRSPRYHNFTSQDVDHLHTLRSILQKQEQEVLQLRQQNRELKCTIQDMQHDHNRETEDLTAKVKKLTDDKENYLQKENKLLQQINDKIISNKQMSIVMEEYEKTISSLIEEQQREKVQNHETLEKVTSERDQALNHLSNMESSFNDLLTKYEKCKSVILETKEREKVYEQKMSEYQAAVKKYEELYGNLKQVTSEALIKANETLDNLKKNYNIEVTKLNATVKKHEITIASLQESLVQKTRDNEELMRLYDQLISETDMIWCFNEPSKLDSFTTTCDSDHNEGFSKCSFDMSSAGRGLFHGYLDTRVPKDGRIKKAGYCAMRSKRVRIRGDGRSYLLNISCEGFYDITWNDIYHYVLYTRGGPYWQIAKIPFSKFVLGSKGRLQDKQTRFRFDRVTHFGISCGDKIVGNFDLEIEYIGLEFDPTHNEEFAYEMYKTDKYIVRPCEHN